jgi:uncharacterized protein YidB (DUF937 family)
MKLEGDMNWINRLFEFFSFAFVPASAVIVTVERNERDKVLGLLQDYIKSEGGIDEVRRRFESAGFIGKVRSWDSDRPLSINSVEALQLMGWRDLRKMAEKAEMPVDRARELLAELLPIAVKRAFSK